MTYNQWPYKIVLKDQRQYWIAYQWCISNLTKGLWAPDYTNPTTLKFTCNTDAVEVTLRFG